MELRSGVKHAINYVYQHDCVPRAWFCSRLSAKWIILLSRSIDDGEVLY